MALSFEFLKNCQPRDLVRVNLDDRSEFAILAAPEGRQYQALVVLSDTKGCYCINLLTNGHIEGDFETYKVLRYGGDYEIKFEHHHGEVERSPLFQQAGVFVLTEHGSYLCAQVHPTQVRYLELETGKLGGERGGGRAAYPGWSLFIKGEQEPIFKFKFA